MMDGYTLKGDEIWVQHPGPISVTMPRQAIRLDADGNPKPPPTFRIRKTGPAEGPGTSIKVFDGGTLRAELTHAGETVYLERDSDGLNWRVVPPE